MSLFVTYLGMLTNYEASKVSRRYFAFESLGYYYTPWASYKQLLRRSGTTTVYFTSLVGDICWDAREPLHSHWCRRLCSRLSSSSYNEGDYTDKLCHVLITAATAAAADTAVAASDLKMATNCKYKTLSANVLVWKSNTTIIIINHYILCFCKCFLFPNTKCQSGSEDTKFS